jgi:hypothetical protein
MKFNATPPKLSFRWTALSVGVLFGVAHLGVLGHLIRKDQLPIINLPVGDYTAYRVEASKHGYSIQYRANSPHVMGKDKVIVKKNGFFGIGGDTKIVQRRKVVESQREE